MTRKSWESHLELGFWDGESDKSKKHKSFQLPGAKPHYNPDRPGQVEHIALDLVLDIPNQAIAGTCKIRLNPVRDGISDLTLDAVNLRIDHVEINTQIEAKPDPDKTKSKFDYDGEFLKIYLNEPTRAGVPLEIAIAYAAEQPQRGIYFVKPTEHQPNKPTQVWTQGEDEDSRYWFPCFDYPGQLATSEISIRVPKELTVISNGELIEVKDYKKEKTYHWSQKEIHPSYLMTLAIGDFLEVKDVWKGKPVTYYVDKSRSQEEAILTMGKTPRMIEFFSEKYGYDYAFPKYAQVCVADFIFGGMENTSATLLTDRCVLDARAALDNRFSESLVAHELAHQWFGDLLVIKHWSHAWVKEGAATYAEVLWTDHEYGAEEAAYYRLGEARSYLAEDRDRYRRPMVTHVYREAIELYDRHIYEKGGCVYHMLRTELGDALFWKAIHHFVQTNAHKTVETIDLLRAIEEATGKNCMFLFDQYVFRGGHPEYKVGYSWDSDNNLAKVTVAQTQDELFDLKIPIGFGFEEGEPQVFTVKVFEKEQAFYFPLKTKPQYISFDRGNNYLKQVTLEYGVAELKAGLQFDPDPLARIQCAEALAKKGGLEAVKALGQALIDEKFWGVRVEIADNLATIKLDQAFEALAKGLEDPNAKVRNAVLSGLAQNKVQKSLDLIKPFIKKGDPSYTVEANAARLTGELAAALSADREPSKVVKLLQTVLKERSGWNEVVRSGAIAGLAKIKDSDEALETVIKYTEPDVPQPLRLAAIRALGAMGKSQTKPKTEQILNRLQIIAQETFFLTQMSVVAALGQVDSAGAIGVLRSLSDSTPDGRVRRVADEAIQRVQKAIGKDAGLKQLREELDQLRKDNQSLKSRLEAIEAKSKTS
ncbi:M1 family metallopeptidase [Pseudanabaena sp. FACHB-1998]|uniref:M1 family metallopeptidase n=1 Tax=Pseudanabaena sp. FACHB-1998 TaxID=2692858 RepID=UPI001681220C|nr:M1 family metallopeptidase [Pseudanabaena sp. FACHB-1998]MBD2177181.1 M1 family metallopeptidase [Pseudanabaena sp. FACHB-1998]